MNNAKSLTVRSTSLSSAVCGDVVLREKERTRLIFRPELVDNPHDNRNSVKGTFIFQRKSKAEQWEDVTGEKLSHFKAGEGYKLELASAELRQFVGAMNQHYALHKDQGIPRGEVEYILSPKNLSVIIKQLLADEGNVQQLVDAGAGDLLLPYLQWFTKLDNREQVFDVLRKLDPSSLADIESVVRLSALKRVRAYWEKSKENSTEKFWQDFLKKCAWIFSQVFSYPVIVHQGGAYVGGKTFANSGGKLVDFLVANSVTNNAALIEIKTPKTLLLGKEYRDDVYPFSSELAGAVSQLSNYRNTLVENAHTVLANESSLKAFYPKCLLIAGSTTEFQNDSSKVKSFELNRGELRNIEVITFDELFAKVDGLISLFAGADESDVPF